MSKVVMPYSSHLCCLIGDITMANRKGAEEFILKYINKLIPDSDNNKMYQDYFKTLSDTQFKEWMGKLATGEEILTIVAPNLSAKKLNVKRNLDLGKELGHEFFKRLWITSDDGKQKRLLPRKHLVYKLPIRRQAQLLVKKISIPKDNNVRDVNTGQASGESKGAKISYVELQLLSALGLDNSILEVMKTRGGDEGAFRAMNTYISRTGDVSNDEIMPHETGVKSTKLLSTYLKAAHLDNTL